MKDMKMFVIPWILFLGMYLSAVRVEAAGVFDTCGVQSSNISMENYEIYGSPVDSYVYSDEKGMIYRLETINSRILVESFDASYNFKSRTWVNQEMPLLGGFYAGSSGYYLVFGQDNLEESDNKEVLRLVKYDKEWRRIASFCVKGANTYRPFRGGSLRMQESNGILYIHSCHEMYQSGGIHHQANMTYAINTKTMEEVSSYYGVMNLSEGYVSHSFNQFVETDGQWIYRIDHGDAYPRGIAVTKCALGGDVSDVSYVVPFAIGGNSGDNRTGLSLGGCILEDDTLIIAGNSVDQNQTPYSATGQRNIFLCTVDTKKMVKKSVQWITSYSSTNAVKPFTPHILSLNDGSILLMWEEYHTSSRKYTTVFCRMDLQGNVISQVENEMRLSDCQPILVKGKVCWYVTDGKSLLFHEIDPWNFDEIKDMSEKTVVSNHSLGKGVKKQEASCEKEGIMTYSCEHCNYEKEEKIAALGHNYVGNQCLRCGNKILIISPDQDWKQPILWSQPVLDEDSSTNNVEQRECNYRTLGLQLKKSGKTILTITWNKIAGAKNYKIYGGFCRGKYQLLAKTNQSSYTFSHLKKASYYKYYVEAEGVDHRIYVSKPIYVATSGGKVGNEKSIKCKKKKITLSKGKTYALKATGIKYSTKEKVKRYRGLQYESSDSSIAKVSSKGVVKAIRSGTCDIYIYAQDGVSCKVRIRVPEQKCASHTPLL